MPLCFRKICPTNYIRARKKDNDSVLKVALDFEVSGNRKRERPKKTKKKQVEERTKRVGIKTEDTLNRSTRRELGRITEGIGLYLH